MCCNRIDQYPFSSLSLSLKVQAYDNFGNNPYFSATATVRVLAISDFKRVLLLLGVPIGSECLTVENERFITQSVWI